MAQPGCLVRPQNSCTSNPSWVTMCYGISNDEHNTSPNPISHRGAMLSGAGWLCGGGGGDSRETPPCMKATTVDATPAPAAEPLTIASPMFADGARSRCNLRKANAAPPLTVVARGRSRRHCRSMTPTYRRTVRALDRDRIAPCLAARRMVRPFGGQRAEFCGRQAIVFGPCPPVAPGHTIPV